MGPEATWARGKWGQKPMGPRDAEPEAIGTEATKVEAETEGR